MFPLFSIGQSIVGQAVFTLAQLDEMDARLDGGGLYVDTNSGSSGFFGDGNQILAGAEVFLNEEQGSGYANRFTWMSSATPIPDYDAGPYEPSPVYSPAGAGTLNVEYIHYASILAAVWNGRSETVTFSGETKSKDAHALDLAQAVIDVLIQQKNDPKLDYTNTSRWVHNNADGNPHFIMIAKMSKYLSSYALVYSQLSGYTPYTSNKTSIETWFTAAKSYAMDRHNLRVQAFLGTNWRNFANNSFGSTTDYGGAGNHQSHVYFNSGGTGFLEVSSAQASATNNRALDFASYVGNYSVHFNDAAAKSYMFDVFRLHMMFAVFSDGSYMEHYRAYDTQPELGLHYSWLAVFKLVAEAYRHEVAIANGLTGASEPGKYFDYSTSIGTDELYSSYPSSSTSGGTKTIKLMIENLSKWYRTTANGGWNDVRYAEGGNAIDEYERPYTLPAAMANTYYNDANLEGFYKMTGTGYGNMSGYYNGAASTGAWTEHSLGISWGEGGTFGGFWGLADMEDIMFSESPVDPEEPGETISDGSVGISFLNFFMN